MFHLRYANGEYLLCYGDEIGDIDSVEIVDRFDLMIRAKLQLAQSSKIDLYGIAHPVDIYNRLFFADIKMENVAKHKQKMETKNLRFNQKVEKKVSGIRTRTRINPVAL